MPWALGYPRRPSFDEFTKITHYSRGAQDVSAGTAIDVRDRSQEAGVGCTSVENDSLIRCSILNHASRSRFDDPRADFSACGPRRSGRVPGHTALSALSRIIQGCLSCTSKVGQFSWTGSSNEQGTRLHQHSSCCCCCRTLQSRLYENCSIWSCCCPLIQWISIPRPGAMRRPAFLTLPLSHSML